MNTNQFIDWLSGFLDGNGDNLTKEEIDIIKSKMKTVKKVDEQIKIVPATSPTKDITWPESIPFSPYPWKPYKNPLDPPYEITCYVGDTKAWNFTNDSSCKKTLLKD